MNLTEIIYKYKYNKFIWGNLDCCIFTAKVVEEYFDKDLPIWKDILNYKDWRTAKKKLISIGCNNLEDLPSIILGTNKKDISKVKLGEPVYYINEDIKGILGICNGKRSYFLQAGGGLTTRNTKDCLYCWSIN